MATRSFRSAGTTVNVTVPSRTRSRSRTTTRARTTPARTTTRTIRQVYTPSRRSNTPLLVGAALAAGALFLLLSPGTPPAGAAPPPGPGPAPVPPLGGGSTPMNPAFPQVAGAPAGYAGPGSYRIVAPAGLNLRPTPNTSQAFSQTLRPGTLVDVIAATPNGWVQISTPSPGYLCLSCPEAPGGQEPNPQAFPPWLVRQA